MRIRKIMSQYEMPRSKGLQSNLNSVNIKDFDTIMAETLIVKDEEFVDKWGGSGITQLDAMKPRVLFVKDARFVDNWGESPGKYTGEIEKGGRRNGYGTMIYDNGARYVGGYSMCQMEGKGKMRYRSGESYNGDWKGGKRDGIGKHKKPSPQIKGGFDVYEGHYMDNVRHGQGVTTHANNTVYRGEYKFDRKDGKGSIEVEGKLNYRGLFQDGEKKVGIGLYRWQGNLYEGDIKGEEMDGFGRTCFKNGDVYRGWYKHNKKEGPGVYIFSNGGSYEGEWRNDNIDGKGTRIYQNGNKFVGSFVNGKKQGYGRAEYGADIYEGDWRDGKFIGKPMPERFSDGTAIVKTSSWGFRLKRQKNYGVLVG